MIYVSFDMVLGAYLIGNMTALIVKGSKTEKFRDRMTDLMKYMNRNKLGRDIRDQIKGHVRLQFESSYTDASVLHDIPISIRSKVIRERTEVLNIIVIVPICFIFDNILLYHLLPMLVDICSQFVYWNHKFCWFYLWNFPTFYLYRLWLSNL
jgi:hypothetical protein